MRLIALFIYFTIPLLALSSSYKVIVETFPTKKSAAKAYEHYQSNPDSIVFQAQNDKNHIVHFRKSGERYIIAVEPFSNEVQAKDFAQQISAIHPTARASKGVADDIEFLLMQHKNLLIQNTKTSPTVQARPTTSSSEAPIPVNSSGSTLPLILVGGILGLILFILWRERSRLLLIRLNSHLTTEKTLMHDSIVAKNDFIAMMSHEIRAPINAIMGISHLVLETRLNVGQRTQITKIKDSANLLLSLINDILDHSKIEAGKVHIEQIPFDLNSLLYDLSNIISHKANEKNIELIFDIDRSVTSKLIGDPLRLFQVLVNLLNNAIKFTDHGSIILRAHGQQISRLNLKIHFDIIDTGIGMSHEQIQKLFQPYTQGDDTISRKYGGTGLGLAISRNLVSLMGGTIQAKSTLHQGSTFSFDIKLHSDSDFDKRYYRLPTADLMSKNALILDENINSASVLRRGLEYFHYETKCATNSIEAITIFNAFSFDIVFIDTKIALSGEFKKALQHRIKNDDVKLVWIGEDHKKIGGILLHKPYSQLDIFNVILTAYGHQDQATQTQDNTKKLKENLKKFAGETLLLAEDNEINRSIIIGLLSGTDIRIITAQTGQEALERVDINPEIRIILMDIQMPIIDGFEASRIIRQNLKNDAIPIIAVTGNAMESDIQKIGDAGMNGHIAKPIDIKTFYTTLYYALDKSLSHVKKNQTLLEVA